MIRDQGNTAGMTAKVNTLTDRQYADFSEVITRILGIKMPASKKLMLQGRLYRRAKALQMETIHAYHSWFFSTPGAQDQELRYVLDLATTNKTEFFREARHFTFLTKTVLASWRIQKSDRIFRVWSAGCSSGEEPYTISMMLLLEQEKRTFQYSVLATDISRNVLNKARNGIYDQDRIVGIPTELQKRFLLRGVGATQGRFKIAPEVRAPVRFGLLNFQTPEYGITEKMDAVFFRNVLIYFERDVQRTIVERIGRCMRRGAYLFIGHAENLTGQDLPFESIAPAIYRKTDD